MPPLLIKKSLPSKTKLLHLVLQLDFEQKYESLIFPANQSFLIDAASSHYEMFCKIEQFPKKIVFS